LSRLEEVRGLANRKSAIKMIRVAARRTITNKPVRTEARTRIDTAEHLIASKPAEAQAAVVAAISALDKAAGKGVLHPNNVARRKARLMKKLNAATAK
jgi:small subunit ribosomal protein S20